jgi:CO/xanthine dehydrogenase Mo-binding subunit
MVRTAISYRGDAKLLQVLFRQARKNRLVYLVLAESRLVFFEAEAPQPTPDTWTASTSSPKRRCLPYNSGANASRVTYMLCRAVGDATEVVKKKIFKHAAALLECDESDLELGPGGILGVVGAPGPESANANMSLVFMSHSKGALHKFFGKNREIFKKNREAI